MKINQSIVGLVLVDASICACVLGVAYLTGTAWALLGLVFLMSCRTSGLNV